MTGSKVLHETCRLTFVRGLKVISGMDNVGRAIMPLQCQAKLW